MVAAEEKLYEEKSRVEFLERDTVAEAKQSNICWPSVETRVRQRVGSWQRMESCSKSYGPK